jgi:hypothetical protein
MRDGRAVFPLARCDVGKGVVATEPSCVVWGLRLGINGPGYESELPRG